MGLRVWGRWSGKGHLGAGLDPTRSVEHWRLRVLSSPGFLLLCPHHPGGAPGQPLTCSLIGGQALPTRLGGKSRDRGWVRASHPQLLTSLRDPGDISYLLRSLGLFTCNRAPTRPPGCRCGHPTWGLDSRPPFSQRSRGWTSKSRAGRLVPGLQTAASSQVQRSSHGSSLVLPDPQRSSPVPQRPSPGPQRSSPDTRRSPPSDPWRSPLRISQIAGCPRDPAVLLGPHWSSPGPQSSPWVLSRPPWVLSGPPRSSGVLLRILGGPPPDSAVPPPVGGCPHLLSCLPVSLVVSTRTASHRRFTASRPRLLNAITLRSRAGPQHGNLGVVVRSLRRRVSCGSGDRSPAGLPAPHSLRGLLAFTLHSGHGCHPASASSPGLQLSPCRCDTSGNLSALL